jgi:hypothetical protein
MSGKNIVELDANAEIDGQQGFEASFAPTEVHEVMIVMHRRHLGPPIVVLSDGDGATQEVHPLPLSGREGRYATRLEGGRMGSKVRVTTARDIVAKLEKVKLIGGHKHVGPPAATPPV